MTIHFACECGRPFAVRNKRAGKAARCPDCGQKIVVPAKDHSSPSARLANLRRVRAYREDTEELLGGYAPRELLDRSDFEPPSRAPEGVGSPADTDPGILEDDDAIVGGFSPEQWAASGFPTSHRMYAQSSGASEQHDAFLVAGEEAAEPDLWEPRRRTIRLTILLLVFGILVLATPGITDKLRLLFGGRRQTTTAIAHNDRGVALEAQDQLPEAIAEFRKAIRLQPQLFEAHYNLGNALDAAREFQQALRAFQEAVKLKPSHAGANFGLGAALYKTGQYPEAEQQLRNTLRLYAGHAEAHLYLSYTLYKRGRFEEAMAELHTAYDLGAHFNGDYAERLQAALDKAPE